jgi:hypothetical protein
MLNLQNHGDNGLFMKICLILHNANREMRNLHILSATRRWHRSYRTLHLLRLFSVSSRLKITHCDTYSGKIWKEFVHQCKVFDISSVLSMKIPQDAHRDNVFFAKIPYKILHRYSCDSTSTEIKVTS